MKETIIQAKREIDEYFLELPYATKDELHRYRKVDMPHIDERGRFIPAQQEDKRKGKIINNRAFKNLDHGSWELFATKMPNGDIITTDKKFAERLKSRGLLIDTGDEWDNEQELKRIDILCKKGELKGVKDYRVLMKI